MREPKEPGRPGALTFFSSVRFAARGIRYAASHERNFRIDLVLLLLSAVLAVYLRLDLLRWSVLLLCWGLVLGAELMNSALEAVVDLVQPEYHDLAGIAKDCAAGAVLITAGITALVGIFLLVWPLFRLWFG